MSLTRSTWGCWDTKHCFTSHISNHKFGRRTDKKKGAVFYVAWALQRYGALVPIILTPCPYDPIMTGGHSNGGAVLSV